MDMMTLTQLAQLTDLAPPTVRRYLDDYILYIPSVRVDGTVGFPAEAIPVVRAIHRLTTEGNSHTAITAQLETMYPITVISSQPLEDRQELPPLLPALAALLQDVDGRYRAVHEMLASLRDDLSHLSTDQRAQQLQQLITSTASTTFQHFNALESVPADLIQIKQAIGVLATRVERASTASQKDHQLLAGSVDTLGAQVSAAATLPATGMAALKAEIAEIRHALTAQSIELTNGTADSLRPELESLRAQIAEMRQERGQMFSLMSALQDNLVQLHMELAEARELRASIPVQPPVSRNGNGAPHLVAMPQQVNAADLVESGEEREPGTDKLRTPRRLGHITGR